MEVRMVDQFEVISKNGTRYHVIEYLHFTTSRTTSGQPFEGSGTRELRLSDGRHVNPTDDPETFKIVENDEVIRKVS